ncbi:MAG: hypothetical protein KDA71_07195, partial [Planctomycetales bacterium]|nr:hypothetical protein [Planctomycetales bacterium]
DQISRKTRQAPAQRAIATVKPSIAANISIIADVKRRNPAVIWIIVHVKRVIALNISTIADVKGNIVAVT